MCKLDNNKYVINKFFHFLMIEGKLYTLDPFSNTIFFIKKNDLILFEVIKKIKEKFFISENNLKDYTNFIDRKFTSNLAIVITPLLVKIGFLSLSNVLLKVTVRHDDFELLSFLMYRKNFKFFDYSSKNFYKVDRKRMLLFLKTNKYPAIECNSINDKKYYLNYPSLKTSVMFPVDKFFYYCFAAQKRGLFLEMLDIFIKSVPSKGARHCFDVFFLGKNSKDNVYGLLGQWVYLPYTHSFAESKVFNVLVQNKLSIYNCFWVVCSYERFQWRYRDSWSYSDIFLDLGHVIEMMKRCSKEFDLSLEFIELPKDITSNLKMEIMVGFKIDEIKKEV